MDKMTFATVYKPSMLTGLLGILTLLTTDPVWAASGDAPQQSLAGAGLMVTLGIVYLSRRRAIGGWLLYFYLQLYLSTAISLIFVPQVFANLNPGQWDNSFLYVMFFLSVVPVLATEVMEVFAATRLLLRRNKENVRFLKNTLLVLVSSSAIALAIDLAYFKDNPAFVFDIITLLFSIIWSVYFGKSKRVRAVFIERKWTYTSYSKRRALTREDKRKLLRRALITTLASFVVFLLIMGYSLKDDSKQANLSILWVPLFYAVIAGIVAWCLPIRKHKNLPGKDVDVDRNQRSTKQWNPPDRLRTR